MDQPWVQEIQKEFNFLREKDKIQSVKDTYLASDGSLKEGIGNFAVVIHWGEAKWGETGFCETVSSKNATS